MKIIAVDPLIPTEHDFEMVNRVRQDILETSSWFDGTPHLTPEQEEILEWALEFLKRYEKRHGRYADKQDTPSSPEA